MGIVHGNWLTGTHSGRACRHENVYTRVNKKTGQCYSAQLCNPNPYRNEKQKKVTTAFAVISAAISAWIATEKAKSAPSDDFKKVKLAFDRQTRYSTMRGMMMAKGMYKVVDGAVVVDPNANTSFATVSASVKLPDDSANAPASPDNGSGSDSGSGSTSGSQTGGSDSGSGSQGGSGDEDAGFE
ncbi:MAG: hypothetical protein ACI4AW_02290 [Paludibacteraceae bacterium]